MFLMCQKLTRFLWMIHQKLDGNKFYKISKFLWLSLWMTSVNYPFLNHFIMEFNGMLKMFSSIKILLLKLMPFRNFQDTHSKKCSSLTLCMNIRLSRLVLVYWSETQPVKFYMEEIWTFKCGIYFQI